VSADDEPAAPSRAAASAPLLVDGWLRLCRGEHLAERGEAVLFDLPIEPGARFALRGFAIRFGGQAYAYVNRCAHVPVELDWVPGQVFDADQRHLICSVHGAEYDPASGHCLAGPCRGRGHLLALAAAERHGWVWVGTRPEPPGRSLRPAPPAVLDFRDDD
jgi:nitrite reductase/ring-hydroxylating ferredoxin subunit